MKTYQISVNQAPRMVQPNVQTLRATRASIAAKRYLDGVYGATGARTGSHEPGWAQLDIGETIVIRITRIEGAR